MKILAIETSTEACSAALFLDGEVIEDFRLAPREHGKLILQMIESLMADSKMTLSDLDGLAFGRGPGSFTGLRIATGVIQGLAFGAELPVMPISTLAAISLQAQTEFGGEYFFPAFDARMDEVYWGVYQTDKTELVVPLVEERVCSAEAVLAPCDIKGAAVGSGWASHRQLLGAVISNERITTLDAERLPRASAIARLAEVGFKNGRGLPAERAQPVYLRDKVAKKKAEQLAEKAEKLKNSTI